MKEGADSLQISGIDGNRLQSQYAISKNRPDDMVLKNVTSIISLIMSYTKEYFYVLAALKKEGRRKEFEIQKFKLTQAINEPFEFVCSVAGLEESNRIAATKYMEGKIEKELILVSGDKFRIFNSNAEEKTIELLAEIDLHCIGIGYISR